MNVPLHEMGSCFEGVIPSLVATVDADGMPNISFLSQVHAVDDAHVALTNQFFSKTAANVAASGQATLLVVDGLTGDHYLLDLRFERSETEGDLFDEMAAQLKATSAPGGLDAVMALRSADIYEVRHCSKVPPPSDPVAAPDRDRRRTDHLRIAAPLAAAIGAAADPDEMFDCALDGLADCLGLGHTMLFVCSGDERRLIAIASHGYDSIGAGAEVVIGEGVVGMAAAARRSIRISDMSRKRRMVEAARETSRAEAERTIPQPGLASPQSQMAVPLTSQGRLRGVLFAESERRFAFTEDDLRVLELVAAQLAAGLRLMELEPREGEQDDKGHGAADEVRTASAFRLRYYAYDDSVFIDDAYVIKGVPGRLLHHFLATYVATGRQEFANREIRLDPSLRLPDLKDNLETRLILLRRRLDDRAAPVRIERPARGVVRLVLHGSPTIEVVADE